uniref:YdeI/OmpD-associated family protein n=1 Tax=Fulvivirga sp. TaxID=1931237 RepID=UPI00404926ED
MHKFKATINIIGINPYVFVPLEILEAIFQQADKEKGPIPICGKINNKPYTQTLVKYKNEWRLYINTTMLKNSPQMIGETIELTVKFDPSDRTVKPHPKLLIALKENPEAEKVFQELTPSLKKEIIRYITFLKTEKSIDKNIDRGINFLLGKESFIGRKGLKS